MASKSPSELKVQNYVFILVVTVWAISVIADIVTDKFDVPIETTAVVGGIVGYFTANSIKKPKSGD